jgi:hypothetical protein
MSKNKNPISYTNLYTNHIKSIFDVIGIANKFYVEIGFNKQKNKNDHTIYFKQNKWKGLWIANTDYYLLNNDILNINISRDNINSQLTKNIIPNNFDLLVLNTGVNDFWLWDSLHYKPSVIMIPYNPFIEYEESKTITYQSNYTNINTECYGSSSFNALNKLAIDKSYKLLNSNNYYLFFVIDYLYETHFKKQSNTKQFYNKPENDLKNIYENCEFITY